MPSWKIKNGRSNKRLEAVRTIAAYEMYQTADCQRDVALEGAWSGIFPRQTRQEVD